MGVYKGIAISMTRYFWDFLQQDKLANMYKGIAITMSSCFWELLQQDNKIAWFADNKWEQENQRGKKIV